MAIEGGDTTPHMDGRTSLKGVWSPATGRFDGERLPLEIMRRGMTLNEFAAAAECSRTSVYTAVRGVGVRDRTALDIMQALARIAPRLDL